jgi:hypothetical protein
MLRNRPFPTGSEPSRQNRKRAVEAPRQGGGRQGKRAGGDQGGKREELARMSFGIHGGE